MSILTKVFVVLVSVLSVVLVTLIVPFVANTENYKSQVDVAKADAAAARSTAQTRQSEIQSLTEKGMAGIQDLKATITEQQAKIGDLTTRLATAQAETASERTAKIQADANVSRLSAAQEQQAQIVIAMETELKGRRPEMVKQQTQIIQLMDRNNEITSQLESLNRQVRRYSEDISQLSARNAQLEEQLARVGPAATEGASSAAASVPFYSDVIIPGKVTDIQSSDESTFAQINVGKNDGVQENMKFLVHRGGQYIGTLVVMKVDAKASAGRLTLAQGALAIGDEVISGAQ